MRARSRIDPTATRQATGVSFELVRERPPRLRSPAISIVITAKRAARVAIRYGGALVAAYEAASPRVLRFRRRFEVRLAPSALTVDEELRSDAEAPPAEVLVRIALPVHTETAAEGLAQILWPEPPDPQGYPSVGELRSLARALLGPARATDPADG